MVDREPIELFHDPFDMFIRVFSWSADQNSFLCCFLVSASIAGTDISTSRYRVVTVVAPEFYANGFRDATRFALHQSPSGVFPFGPQFSKP